MSKVRSSACHPALAALLHGQTLYTNLEVLPALMLERGPEPGDARAMRNLAEGAIPEKMPSPLPIKTIPVPPSPRCGWPQPGMWPKSLATRPKRRQHFIIGYTREQGHPVCIDLEKFVQRSSGVFGATGTGKSFLTRIMLAGLIQYNKASLLVFDMHNEYGYDDTASDTNTKVPGLRTKFPARVRMVGLGATAAIRGAAPDFNLEIAEKDIQPEDIEMLTRELNLKETTPTTLDALVRELWRRELVP